MPSISIKKGVSVVRLYDGERRQLSAVRELLRSIDMAAFDEDIKEAASAAVVKLVEFEALFPLPETKPSKKKAAAA